MIKVTESPGLEAQGAFKSLAPPKSAYDKAVEADTEYHEGEVTWVQTLRVPETIKPGGYTIRGTI